MSTFVIEPHDTVLAAKYEALNPNQRKFADRLIEEKYFRVEKAIDMASKIEKWDRFGNPRSKKVDRIFRNEKVESVSDLIELKEVIQRYQEFDYEDQMYVYKRVYEDGDELEGALREVYYPDENYIFICTVISPDGGPYCYGRKKNPNEVWDWQALHEIGDAMLEKNIYPGCMIEDIRRGFATEYSAIKHTRIISSWIDEKYVAKNAILESSIDYVRDPDSQYDWEYYVYLNIEVWKHLGGFAKPRNMDDTVLSYDVLINKYSKRWLNAMREVGND